MKYFDPILSNGQAAAFERQWFERTGISELEVIASIGKKISESFIFEFPAFAKKRPCKVLAVLGSGHNAADAMAFLESFAQKAPLEKRGAEKCAGLLALGEYLVFVGLNLVP